MFIPGGTEEATPRQKFPVVTVTLVALNSLVFLFELFHLLAGRRSMLNQFIAVFGMTPSAISSGQNLFALFTSLFAHGSLTHIRLNMLYLFAFGDNMKDHLGRWRSLLFYTLAGLFAILGQIAVNPGSSNPNVALAEQSQAFSAAI
ncbi:MAG: rhomboid family intramembrane serine protease [Anaerolineae bacterium]|nr:rhomboid family intramembrane serine protease [Anaerolineae bacterium]